MSRLPTDRRGRQLAQLLARDQYERWLAREVEVVLRGTFQRVVTGIVTRRGSQDVRSRAFQQSLAGELGEHIRAGYADAERITATSLGEFARLERDVAADTLEVMTGRADSGFTQAVISRTQLRAVAALPIDGLALGEWWQSQAAQMTIATRRQIQVGILAGETPQQIARRVVGARDQREPDVWRRARRDAHAVVRTSVTTVQNAAAFDTYQAAGPDVSTGYEYVSARDERVSDICRALDGRTFSYSDPRAPKPPQHINCRSTIVPVINWAKLGLPKPGPRSALTFPSYADWLRGESEAVQNRILGRAGGESFRRGKGLAELVRDDGRRKTVEQLRREFGFDFDPARRN